MTPPNLSRRHFGILSLAAMLKTQIEAADKAARGKVKHSACKWCYKEIPL
jgi:hydroxypyruvate isomerase